MIFKELGQYWLNKLNELPNIPSTDNGYSGIWRVMFEIVAATASSPQDLNLDTKFVAEGKGIITTRSDWTE